jgi:formamidopyrimidine-DNA glycosylase
MPELPEVETIVRQLAPRVEGRAVRDIVIADPRWCEPADPRAVEDALRGQRIDALRRRGKYLIAELGSGTALICHLRMTGTVLYDPDGDPPHTRVRIDLDDGHRLRWVDPRRFGTGHLVPDREALDAYLDARLALEPLDPRFTADHLRELARGRRAPVKAFILDQRRMAGVGNIYADEALFRARIHPLRPAGTLNRRQIEALREALIASLKDGIDARGATIDGYRDVDGVSGSFQDRFLVHRRAGRPCPECGTTVVKLVAAGRGTYLCPRCQPRPRTRTGARRPSAVNRRG